MPQRQPFILASLVAITIGLLAWNWPTKGDADEATIPAPQKSVSPRHSTIKTRAARLATHLSVSRLKPANINANARLSALYERYPELETELHEPTPELVSRFEKLFPNPSDPDFGNASDFDSMILGDSPWDESSAAEFLDKNANRLTELSTLIEAFEDFEQIQFSGLGEAQRLLSVSYGLYIKLGRLDQARELYATTQTLIEGQMNGNLIQTSISITLSRSLSSYNLQLITEQPGLITQLEPSLHSTPSFAQTIQGEFTGSIRLFYNFAEQGADGELYFDIGDETKNYVPIEIVEDSLARLFIENIRHLKEYEMSDTYISGTEIDQEIAAKFAENPHLTPVDKQLAEVTFIGLGYYFEALKHAQQLQTLRALAIEISYAHSQGKEWSSELPIDYRTREPIIWDQENNLLETGLEGDDAIINIPVIPPK